MRFPRGHGGGAPVDGKAAVLTRLRDIALDSLGAWPLNLLVYALLFPVVELFFWFETRRYQQQQSAAEHTSFRKGDSADAERIWYAMLESGDAVDVEEMLSSWFHGVWPTKSDAVRFVGWSMFNSTDLQASEAARVSKIVERAEAVTGRAWAPPAATMECMTYTLEDLTLCHKPLAWYLLLQSLHKAVEWWLRRMGFRRLRVLDDEDGHGYELAYWCRSPLPSRENAFENGAPTVLLHGVLGLLPYVLTLYQLARSHEGTILVPLFPVAAIAARPHPDRPEVMPPVGALVRALRRMVTLHTALGQQPSAAWFGHSLGTAVLAAVVRSNPELVVGAVLADPICFELASGEVLRNFLYTSPPLQLRSWYHFIQRTFVTRDPSVQFCFRRSFWWAHYWLHPDDLPCDTLVVLSGRDTVANAYSVKRHLAQWQRNRPPRTRPRCTVQMHGWWYHGFMMLQPTAQRRIINELVLMATAAQPKKSSAPTVASHGFFAASRQRAGVDKRAYFVDTGDGDVTDSSQDESSSSQDENGYYRRI